MGQIISINHPGSERYDDPATRADAYFSEALRMIVAAGEAVQQIEGEAERVTMQTRFLRIANAAMEGLAES